MARTIADVKARKTAQGADRGYEPPRHADNAPLVPGPVPGAGQDRAQGPEGGGVCLAQTVDRG